MKRLSMLILAVATAFCLGGCARHKDIDNKTYEPFGMLNESAIRDPSITYEVSFGSVMVAIILSETVIVPIYVIGWDLMEPVKAK